MQGAACIPTLPSLWAGSRPHALSPQPRAGTSEVTTTILSLLRGTWRPRTWSQPRASECQSWASASKVPKSSRLGAAQGSPLPRCVLTECALTRASLGDTASPVEFPWASRARGSPEALELLPQTRSAADPMASFSGSNRLGQGQTANQGHDRSLPTCPTHYHSATLGWAKRPSPSPHGSQRKEAGTEVPILTMQGR